MSCGPAIPRAALATCVLLLGLVFVLLALLVLLPLLPLLPLLLPRPLSLLLPLLLHLHLLLTPAAVSDARSPATRSTASSTNAPLFSGCRRTSRPSEVILRE